MSKSATPHLLPIEKNSETRRREVLTNALNMLANRGLINSERLDKAIEKVLKHESDDNVYQVDIDNVGHYYPSNNDTKKLYIKMMPMQKVTGITKTSPIGEFLYQYRNNPKLVVVGSITAKGVYQSQHEHIYTEIFLEQELMIDIVRHISVPEHILLTDEESNNLRNEYGAKKRDLPKIYVSDPIAKYYNAKPDQIFRIIRPSETAGQTVYYRLVIKGNIDG